MKKQLARITALSTALCALTLSTSISFAADDSSISPLSDGQDFDIALYNSKITDVTGKSAYLWAYTEGEGRDLTKVRVESRFYVNGSLVDSDTANGTSYASVDYNASAKQLMDVEIRSIHYAYNKIGDAEKRSSNAVWPK
ncbi:hypothetical protein [Brevibacillus reuszeri]|uniref:hypothetical protein n=1 Tax=Brevibacillus reuszeri TaxID=54915 RepID=UPI003D1AF023